ncbi:MAG: transposase domain-containing protein, partial [Oscillospiraceae bacterium]
NIRKRGRQSPLCQYPGGANTSAIIYSLTLTAKESGLEPYRYLTWLMTTAPALDLADAAQVEALTPEIVTDLCRTRGG